MRVDIFKREEEDGGFSYLIVPEGKNIPGEATNVDWILEAHGIDIDPEKENLDALYITCPGKQLHSKGYAISHLPEMPD